VVANPSDHDYSNRANDVIECTKEHWNR
jgi:hypothetical protein